MQLHRGTLEFKKGKEFLSILKKTWEGEAWERGRGRQVVLAASSLSLLLSPILELPYYRWGLVLSS